MNKNKLDNIKKSVFKVPDNYFNNLEDQIIDHAKINEMKSDAFKIPDGYLDTLEDSVLSKVSKNEDIKVVSLFTKKNLVYISSIAAAVLLFFNLSIFENKDTFAELNLDTIDNYILDEASDNDLASLFLDGDINDSQFVDYNLNEDIIDLYLESVDVEELILE